MNNLKKYRCQNNLTQSELGEKLGISKSAVSLFEIPNSTKKLSKKTAEKASVLLNCSVIELFGWENFKIIPQTKQDKLFLINLLQSSLDEQEN